MIKHISIKDILQEHGPLASSKVKEFLISAGISNDAARQRLSRAKAPVRRLLSLNLPNNEGFLYLDRQYASSAFWQALLQVHTEKKSVYGLALHGLLARGGTIPKQYFDIVCGSPRKLKRHVSSFIVLEQLIAVKFLKEIEDPIMGTCITIDANGCLPCSSIRTIRSNLVVEDLMINGVKDWAKKIGLAAYNQIMSRLDGLAPPMFGQFAWDITGPSYIFPFVEKGKKTIPGFFVADVINGELNEGQVLYFLNKCKTNRYFKKMRPFMALLVAEQFTEEAYSLGRSAGVIFTSPSTLFGDELAESLRDLNRTLEIPTAIATKQPENIGKLFFSLSRINGETSILQEALFKLIVGHLVFQEEDQDLKIDFTLHDSEDHSLDVDVQRIDGNHKVLIYECNGGHSRKIISKSEVQIWLNDRIPVMRTILFNNQKVNDVELVFEYWTSGIFSKDAINELNNAKRKAKNFSLGWKDGSEVLAYAEKVKASSIVEVLKGYYITNSEFK